MCGTIKFENMQSKIGDLVVAYSSLKNMNFKAIWSGFAKFESKDWWIERGATQTVFVHADSFIEHKQEFKMPGGIIGALGLRRDVMVNGKIIGHKGSIKILTREARNPFELKVHERFPLALDENKRPIIFEHPQRSMFNDL